jgi:hypothetical protein
MFRNVGQFVLQGAINLANETTVELLIPDRQNIYSAMYWPITVINPDLKIKNSWNWLEAETYDDLTQMILDKTREFKQPLRNTDSFAARRRWFRRTPRLTGIKGAGLFDYDVNLMKISKELLNFGRIDVYGDDGVWFDSGLTKSGITALAAMNKIDIALHLIGPSRETLREALEETNKPFLLSGYIAFDQEMIAKIKTKNVLIAVDFNPEDVQGCVTQLEMLKTKLDTTSNLFLNVTSEKGFNQAKQQLFQDLIKKGWAKNEIYAIAGRGISRRSQGNLDVLPGGRPPFPGQR